MSILVLWLVLGIASIGIAAVAHVILAEKRGYEALKFWGEVELEKISTREVVVKIIFGLLIWPVGLINFMMDLPKYYDMYELKDEEIES